jgi:hypothetical protein
MVGGNLHTDDSQHGRLYFKDDKARNYIFSRKAGRGKRK